MSNALFRNRHIQNKSLGWATLCLEMTASTTKAGQDSSWKAPNPKPYESLLDNADLKLPGWEGATCVACFVRLL